MPETDVTSCFVRPPEAPVFEPTPEEFQDPMKYLSKIRPMAEQSGICKIRPPSTWTPPFAVDIDHFKFTPRIQRLNELEAKTRVKLNFLEKLSKFWELQGVVLKIPLIEKRYLDLYALHKAVRDFDGFDLTKIDHKWSRIAVGLGYQPGKNIGNTIRQHYEKILYPYQVFLLNSSDFKHCFFQNCTEILCFLINQRFAHVLSKSLFQLSEKHHLWTLGVALADSKKVDFTRNSELKKLQFFGAGPKTALPDAEVIFSDDDQLCLDSFDPKLTRRRTRDKRSVNYSDSLLCRVCVKSGNSEALLVCDVCGDVFHNSCLIAPLQEMPAGEWRCAKCIARECHKPIEVYGFEQGKREYTLQTFGEMADQFKQDYFNSAVHTVPCSVVEKEFWRLVNCIEEDVVVEYGADNPSAECGSGFPTEKTRHLFPDDEEYIMSPWNLNNLPVLKQSVLHYINAEISGMKVPWCYVGMCFASFAWHIEDHWNYSINYLHWGEPKTWYGVPSSKAELLEQVMKRNAPELFEQSPDLLHQLTTLMNPNTLMSSGVPVVRTDQHAGEFIVTFPRAYHSGFNQGYNFAEAVNFSMADWLPVGRGCIEHYRVLKRQCVFSHDELVCRMASLPPGSLDLTMSIMVFFDMLTMVEEEKSLRKEIFDEGTHTAEKEAFELLPDDERQCDVCRTTCFLSAVTCSCNESRRVCLNHIKDLCQCPPRQRCLRYRYTLDELLDLLSRLKDTHTDFELWARRAKQALDARDTQRLDLPSFKNLIHDAHDGKLPMCALLNKLLEVVNEAEKCIAVARHLLGQKACTRRETGEQKPAVKLTLDQLEKFYKEIATLPCSIKEQTSISELLAKVGEFQDEIKTELASDELIPNRLQKLIEREISFDIEVPEAAALRQALQQTKWLQKAEYCLVPSAAISLAELREIVDEGLTFVSHKSCQTVMSQIQKLLSTSDNLEQKAMHCINSRSKCRLSILESIVAESKLLHVQLPSIAKLNEIIDSAKNWAIESEASLKTSGLPCLELVGELLRKGNQLAVQLDNFSDLESRAAGGHEWLESAAKDFLIRKSLFPLLHVLSPRRDINKLLTSESSCLTSVTDFTTPTTSMTSLRSCGQCELSLMVQLRKFNKAKLKNSAATYCICRRVLSGRMFQCQLCCDLFHGSCVAYSESVRNAEDDAFEPPFMCPLCLRTRRPSFVDMLKLLQSLQKLRVWLPEGVAVQYLADRAMMWLESVRNLLNTRELLEYTKLMDLAPSSTKALRLAKGITQTTFNVLEQLMVEGNLLEVSVQEKETLYRILCCCGPPGYVKVVFNFPVVFQDEESSEVKTAKKGLKRKSASIEKNLLTEKKSARSSPKRKRRSEAKTEDKKMTSSNENSEEICAAATCLRPSGDKGPVKWVQCDACELWFHFHCVGLATISEHEEYKCCKCKDSTSDVNRSKQPSSTLNTAINLITDSDSDETTDDNESIDNYIIRSSTNAVDKHAVSIKMENDA